MQRDWGVGETASVNQYLASTNVEGISAQAILQGASFLERLLGAPFQVAPPALAARYGFGILRPLAAAEALRSTGFLSDQLASHSRSHPDEIRRFFFRFGEGSGGSDLFDPEQALWKALAEYTERKLWKFSAEWYRRKLRSGTASSSHDAIDPASIEGFSAEQRRTNPALSFAPSSTFGWIPVRSISDGSVRYAPLQLFSGLYARTHVEEPHGAREPRLRSAVTTGLATGQSLDEALLRGALEVIERDAFMITFLNSITPPRVELGTLAAADPRIALLRERLDRYQLELHIARLPTDFPVHVIAAMVIDRSGKGPAFAMGAKADFDPKAAVFGAVSEALSVRAGIRDAKPIEDEAPIHSLRRDERVRYWADIRRLKRLEFLISGAPMPVPDDVVPSIPEQLARLRTALRSNACETWYAELTTRAIRNATGFRVVYVMSPQLQPLHLDEAFPCIGGARLSSVPEKLGYAVSGVLNTDPHPFP